ncbi:hypothetical protein ACO0K2_19535 [Undibacterium sp. MH2W]|uniref:hypothetical protein n=1 Tax=Undibacterium sp. MH2W TaxID=3413044 RepID=UPI003BF0DD51
MTNQNRQCVEKDHFISVTLVDENRASIFIKQPSGYGDQPTIIDISTFKAGGLSVGESLELVSKIVAIGVRGADLKRT